MASRTTKETGPRAGGRERRLRGLSDNELVRRAAVEHDRKAFSELVDRHKDGVFALVRRLLGRSDEVEDIAQNVFLAAYRGLAAFKGKAKFSTWVYRIAYNQSCSALRKITSRRAREVHEPPVGDGDRPAKEPRDDSGESPERGALKREVWNAVSELPTSLRAVVELHHGRGLSYPEVAEAMGLPLGTVKTHLHRARARLREMLLGCERTDMGNGDG
jgi:RNA polymerase sigma-70 factor (ECF subfamily)